MVLHAHVARLVQLKDAFRIVHALPPLVSAVGLFVDAEVGQIIEMAHALSLAAVQLHGHETPDTVAALAPLPVIKAIQLHDLDPWVAWRPDNLIGFLVDAAGGGGCGVENDWPALKESLARGDFRDFPRWIAAGGLKPQNVGRVIGDLRPWGVDVCSGVEVRPREKSPELIHQFLEAVRQADGVALQSQSLSI
jgi:phosphoribosylanthranilate isomerase